MTWLSSCLCCYCNQLEIYYLTDSYSGLSLADEVFPLDSSSAADNRIDGADYSQLLLLHSSSLIEA